MSKNKPLKAGVISDTHGTFPFWALPVFKNTDMIIHAGDIDTPEVLNELQAIAPVVAVKGNMDKGPWANNLQETEIIEVGEVSLYLLHDIMQLSIQPEGIFHAVIYGHTHRSFAEKQNNVLYLNPGSACYPRHNEPASVALLYISGTNLNVEFVSAE